MSKMMMRSDRKPPLALRSPVRLRSRRPPAQSTGVTNNLQTPSENIVAIDLSYSSIKTFWTTPKCFRRLKVMKLRYCCNLTTTPDFSEITNLEELSLEGCVNLVSVHPSIGMLKRLVVLNLAGCLKFGRYESIQPRWWTSITAPFGLVSKQQHPQISVFIRSFKRLVVLKSLNLSYCNLEQVPESIGGLSCLHVLYLQGNNFTSLPESLSQLSHLFMLKVDGCKKLEVLHELPPSLNLIDASDCTSLREVSGSFKDQIRHRTNDFRNCPKLFKNDTIDSEGSISKTKCLDSSITSQGFIHQLSGFLGSMGFQTNIREFFTQDTRYSRLDIGYHGNSSIPEWFTNRSRGNHVKVELPSDWCFNKFRGYGTCVVFKRKKPHKLNGYSVKNFDGASLNPFGHIPHIIKDYFEKEVIGIQDSYMIWLCYRRRPRWGWEEAKNFLTLSFEENNEDVEVKECGVRLICDGDLQQEDVDLPTLSQRGGAIVLDGFFRWSYWSW